MLKLEINGRAMGTARTVCSPTGFVCMADAFMLKVVFQLAPERSDIMVRNQGQYVSIS